MIPLVFDIDFSGLYIRDRFGIGTVSDASYLTSNEAFQGFRRTTDGQNISTSHCFREREINTLGAGANMRPPPFGGDDIQPYQRIKMREEISL
jgi:hypothetical protein